MEAATILAPVFERQGWVWAGASSESGIPTRDDIARTISRLDESCRNGVSEVFADGRTFEGYSCSTGRLRVTAEDMWGDGEITYALSLELGDL